MLKKIIKAVKRERDEPDEGGVSAKAYGLNRFATETLITTGLVSLLCALAVFYLQKEQLHDAGDRQLGAYAARMASHLADKVEYNLRIIENFAADPAVAQAMELEESERLRAKEQELRKLLPDLVNARLLPFEWDQTDNSSYPPLSFASLDLLRRAEQSGEASTVEMHQFGNSSQHVAVAVPVRRPGQPEVLGTLHVALSPKLITSALGEGSPVNGRIELQQRSEDVPVMLIGVGPPVAFETGQTLPIEGTLWQLAFQQADTEFGFLVRLNSVWIVLAGGVLIFLLMLMHARRLKRAFKRDEMLLQELAERIGSGETGKIPLLQAELVELQGVMDRLRKLSLPGKRKSAVKPTAAGEETAATLAVTQDEVASSGLELGGGAPIPESIFRAYDIRGVVGESLTEEIMFELGRAIGSEAQEAGQSSVIVARDGRESGKLFVDCLAQGLVASGSDVIDIGMVPTPVLYFATHFLGSDSGVMVTGSHNPPEYNGLKIVVGGETLASEGIQRLRQRIESGDLKQGAGVRQDQDLLPDYISRVIRDVQLARPLKVAVDCGNGVAGLAAPALLQALGCDVVELFCDVDGKFPNHHPDPGKPENMVSLVKAVREQRADIGLAFDGDGDRLGVVDSNGKIIWPDRVLVVLARDVLSRQPGADVIYDVKSSRNLASEILMAGGRPVMWKTGHSLIKAKMRETGALLAGEMSGHIFFRERWYGFDDALYSCARLLEIVSAEGLTSADLFAGVPESVATPELNLGFEEEGANFRLMERLIDQADFGEAKLITIDGLRVEFEDGWGLVRPSNTTPALVFRFEADTPEALERIQALFEEQLAKLDPSLGLPN